MALDNTSILPPLPVEDEEAKRRRLQQQKPIVPAVQQVGHTDGGGGEDYSRFIHPFVGNGPVGQPQPSSVMKSASESITPPSPMATPVNLPPVGNKIGLSPEVQAAQQHLQEAQAKATQHHSLVRKIFEGVGTMLAPGLMMAIPGTILNSYWERNQAQGGLNSATENAEREAQTNKINNPLPIQPTNDFELWHQQNPQGTAEQWLQAQEKNKPHPPNSALDLWLRDNPNGSAADYRKFENDSKAPKETSFNANEVAYAHEHKKRPEDLTTAELNEANRGRKEATTIVQPPRQMVLVPQPDGSSKAMEVTPGTVVPKGAQTTSQMGAADEKATVEEKKRADFVTAIEDNLKTYEDIVRRRPDLFGPVAGRMTQLKMAAGTSDPDIAALRIIKENSGLMLVGIHAMRNAQHAEKAGSALMDYMSEPNAILDPKHGLLTTARNSLHSFASPVSEQRGSIDGKPQGGNEIHYKIVNGQLVPE